MCIAAGLGGTIGRQCLGIIFTLHDCLRKLLICLVSAGCGQDWQDLSLAKLAACCGFVCPVAGRHWHTLQGLQLFLQRGVIRRSQVALRGATVPSVAHLHGCHNDILFFCSYYMYCS